MKKLHIKLITAIITFLIGIGFVSLIFRSETVDDRLAVAFRAMHLAQAKRVCNSSRLRAQQTANEPNRIYRVEALSNKQCRKLEEKVDFDVSAQELIELAAEGKDFPATIPDKIAADVESVNKGCKEDNLTERQGTVRKEEAIKDIQKNMLDTTAQ